MSLAKRECCISFSPDEPKEKYVYHQIHPLKLFTDIGAALDAGYQSLWIIVAGCAIVLFGWLRGKISDA